MTAWMDVWSRSGPKYRIRAAVLLCVNILLFAGVGAFAFWIRSGVAFAPAMEGYWDHFALTFRFTGETGVSLGSLLVEPISVQDVPMQIPILGLLMATLIGIPILVAILYRFGSSLPFIAIVGFLAVMPWLAITLLGSCIIASVRPFRTPIRFVSALLGLVPAAVYLVVASGGTTELIAGRIDPVDTIKFTAPWLLTAVAAAGLFAIVLAIARLVNYRTGAITPLLALMFGVPVGLFEFHVGRDELHYRLLEALARAHFQDTDAGADLESAVQRAWQRHPLPRPKWQAVYQIEEEKWQMALAADLHPFETELSRHQAEVAARCDAFTAAFPESRYVFNALFIKARALDTRVDAGEFRRTKWIRFYDDFPNPASRGTWHLIAEHRLDSEPGVVALLRLAQLEAREGDVDRAMGRLTPLVRRFRELPEDGDAGVEGRAKGVLAPAVPEASLHIPLASVGLEIHRLYDLLTANRDPLYGYDPLSGPARGTEDPMFGLLDLDPRSEHYRGHVQRLQKHYPRSQLDDNFALEIGNAAASARERIESLEALLEQFPSGDAVPEGLFRLGWAYKSVGMRDRAEGAFTRLQRDFADSIWAQQARRSFGLPPSAS